jgi:hypothetical protein
MPDTPRRSEAAMTCARTIDPPKDAALAADWTVAAAALAADEVVTAAPVE